MTNFWLALRMMLRDLRAGELHLLGIAIAIAVASLTSVGFLSDRVARGLDREANQLLGGDLLLRADQSWDASMREHAETAGLRVAETVLFTSMVSTDDDARLAGVKVVEDGYPLRGAIRIAPGPNQPDTQVDRVPERGEVWLDERLFAILDVETGDEVALGRLTFRVGGMITFESDRGANFFSFLPRALFNIDDLEDSGLIAPGSRATWRLHMAGALEEVEAFERWAAPRLERGQNVESVENARPEVHGALDQAQRFLRLAALLAVVLAAVAVGLAARRFMRRHLDACAVMRCLGAKQGQVLRLITGEFFLFGIVAALAGAALGWGVQLLLSSVLAQLMQVQLPPPSLLPVAHGIAVGAALLAGFVLPQLLRLHKVSPARVLRRELIAVERVSGAAWLVGCAVLCALVFWIAADVRLGALVVVAFAGALGVFALCAWAVLRLLGRFKGAGSLRGGGWRYGLAALNRRIGPGVIQISALGLGITTLLLLTLIRGDLLDTWRQVAPEDAPNRFIINIQPDQRAPLGEYFAAHGFEVPEILPMIRGRLVAINGEPVDPDAYEDRRTRRLAEREFNLSYASRLADTARIVDGTWHGDERAPQFSIEEGLADTFDLSVGDSVRFNIAGRLVEAPITSVRELDWDSMRVNFFFIAAPGMLEDDPTSLVTAFYQPAEEQDFVTGLVNAFPNLSVIDVAAVIAQVESVIDNLVLVVQMVFAFALLAGLVVLYAAMQATHDERDFELAVLRTLGARNRQLRQALLAEFAVLGAIAGGLGGAAATLIGWLLARHAFDMTYVPSVAPMVFATLAGMAAVVLAGWLGTRGLLARPAMASLRAVG